MKTIFIGPLGGGQIPTNGANIKNYHILKQIQKHISSIIAIDTENWKSNPLILFKLLKTIIRYREGKYIISLNSYSAYKLLKIIKLFAPKAIVIYWVIGGAFAKLVEQKKLSPTIYSFPKNIIVEGASMKETLNKIGITNVSVMPNFKPMRQIDNKHRTHSIYRFVFLSRITPLKGCNIIFDAVKILDNNNLFNYEIDFYGVIDNQYHKEFIKEIDTHTRLNYKGFLDLRDDSNYEILASYDAMLFPTYWPGEGCPGIILDAYMSNLPILASDWNLNRDYISHGKTGIIYPPKNSPALAKTIKRCITGQINLIELSKNTTKQSKKFDIANVLSIENLKKNYIL